MVTHQRRRFQFSLRALVIATLLCGALFGFWRAYVQPRLATIEKVKVTLWYIALEGKPVVTERPGGSFTVAYSVVYVTLFHVLVILLVSVGLPLVVFWKLDSCEEKSGNAGKPS